MSFLEDLLGVQCKTNIGDIHCDATVREAYERSADLSTHPIEFGSDIADHYRPRDVVLTLDCEISETPLGTFFPFETAINSVASLLTGDNPIETAWRELNRYMDDKEAIVVETGLDTFYDMMITSLSVTRGSTTGRKLEFSVTVQTAAYAYTSEIDALAAIAAETATETVQESISDGAQTVSEAGAEEAAASQVAAQALEAAGVLL